MELLKLLTQHSKDGAYPMHMPGHKRNPAFLEMASPVMLDITEISGFDNLHAAEGILQEAMERAGKLWGAKESHFLVNGSSSGILAALSAALPVGGTLAIDRSAHKSAYHGIELRSLRPVYLSRPISGETGVLGSLSPARLERALTAHPEIRGVLITSPTYEGVVSDIRSLAAVAHRFGALLIVDEAHGAHLGFSPAFPKSAVTQGADIVIQSLHKTLPTFTQSAILHICSDRVDGERLRKFLSYYQTTSPSYLLMAGMDACVGLLQEKAEELFAAYEARLDGFYRKMEQLSRIRLLSMRDSEVFGFDPGKLYFSTVGTPLTGEGFGQLLREEFAIEPEMTTAEGCLCMTSIADTDEGFDRLAKAVLTIDARLAKEAALPKTDSDRAIPPLPNAVYIPAEAAEQACETVALSDAVGRLAGEFVWAYPPDIPLLVPGEQIDQGMIAALSRLQERGVRLHSDSEGLPETMRVITD